MLFHPVTRKAVTLNIFLLISKRKKKKIMVRTLRIELSFKSTIWKHLLLYMDIMDINMDGLDGYIYGWI